VYKKKEQEEVEQVSMPDIETTNAAMVLAFEHYTLHRIILLRKLLHAQDATIESLQQANELSANNQSESRIEEFRKIKEEMDKYNELWESAIDLFEDTSVSDEALVKIEEVLSSIPLLIKKYYDALVSQDAELQEMMTQLASEKYEEALKLIRDIQNEPCAMSGLYTKDFDEGFVEMSKAFKIYPPGLDAVD